MSDGHFSRAANWVANRAAKFERSLVNDETTVALDGFERVLQFDRHSCGARCAFMVLRWYGKARSVDAVARALGGDASGVDDASLVQLFRRRGLRARLSRRNPIRAIEDAIREDRPVVVTVDDSSHFGVVYGYSRSSILFADPSALRTAQTIVPRSEFLARWDRSAIFSSK